MDRILGQPHAVAALRTALASGRFHHAWIFAGPRGIGKFTTAVELARILLDPEAVDGRSDLESRTSRLIDAGTHPDLHVIRKELALYSDAAEVRARKLLNIPIDVLRQRMIGGPIDGRFHEAPAHKTAVLGHGKIFILDVAELIDEQGQNLLLKTLEEPPPRTYMLLVTCRPQRLLPTVHSRCQTVRFAPLDAGAMAAWFDRADLGLGADERAWIERFCDGSPGLAMLAAEYGFYRWKSALAPSLQSLEGGRFPDGGGDTMAGLVETFATEWVKKHDLASKDAANKDGARHLLAMLAGYARRRLAEGVERGGTARWLSIIDLIKAAERELASNVNQKLLLENLVVQWAQVRE